MADPGEPKVCRSRLGENMTLGELKLPFDKHDL